MFFLHVLFILSKIKSPAWHFVSMRNAPLGHAISRASSIGRFFARGIIALLSLHDKSVYAETAAMITTRQSGSRLVYYANLPVSCIDDRHINGIIRAEGRW